MAKRFEDKLGKRQLTRLSNLMDVVYALAIWRLFMFLPRPQEDETRTVWQVFSEDPQSILTVVIGMVIVIIYWLQNNQLFAHLARTDTRHTVLSILQIFCLLIFLYAIGLGTRYDPATDLRVLESLTALLVGVPSYFAWRHAKFEGRLLASSVSKQQADDISVRILAEPITAALTLPFVALPWLWEMAWLSFPLVQRLLRRKAEVL